MSNNNEFLKEHIFDLYKRYDTEVSDVRKIQREFIKVVEGNQFYDLESEI